jgi:HPt (histidine-containing phosphotransfer) domain-containing protein
VDDLVQELVPGYLAARRDEVSKMMQLLAASDFERLRVLSHSLKGSGTSFGFPELTRFGAELELDAEALDSVAFGHTLQRLKAYLDELDHTRED